MHQKATSTKRKTTWTIGVCSIYAGLLRRSRLPVRN